MEIDEALALILDIADAGMDCVQMIPSDDGSYQFVVDEEEE